jgi:hypothetical protein
MAGKSGRSRRLGVSGSGRNRLGGIERVIMFPAERVRRIGSRSDATPEVYRAPSFKQE